MTDTHTYTALIAEDEPLLAAALQAELAQVWPQLRVVATVGDGLSAVQQALHWQPDVLFFDIRMPGQTGLEAAAELVDAWPAQTERPFPQLVFVTAYDQYALHAFEAQAVDYLLKPVQRHRLEKCKQKLLISLDNKAQAAIDNESYGTGAAAVSHAEPSQLAHIAALLHTLGVAPAVAVANRLQVIQASHATAQGTGLLMIPVAEVIYFEAADKYVRVLTAEREVLIRTPLKDLMPQLDPALFWQIHRGTVVRADAITQATRDDVGRLWLHLKNRTERLAVSRLYAHLFKAM